MAQEQPTEPGWSGHHSSPGQGNVGLDRFWQNPAANRSLTQQFEQRLVRKKYVLLTDRKTGFAHLTARSWLARAGEKYVGRPGRRQRRRPPRRGSPDEQSARMQCAGGPGRRLGLASGTGDGQDAPNPRRRRRRTGFRFWATRFTGGRRRRAFICTRRNWAFAIPPRARNVLFDAPPDFSADPRWALRAAVIDASATNAFRLVHGAADGWPGLYVDRLGDYLLAQSAAALTERQRDVVEELGRRHGLRGVYHKLLRRQTRNRPASEMSPRWQAGEIAPGEVLARENGLEFGLRFEEGYSVGLFLDQRENRRRLLTGYIAPDFTMAPAAAALNAFAYTCGFSVCAAAGGGRVTSVDLSKKYLEWGRGNFARNGLDASQAHEFIYGDAFEWLRRMGRHGRVFDLIILDPPTFSRSKESGVFQAEKDYGTLVTAALPLLRRDGILLASTNAASLKAEDFLEMVTLPLAQAKRRITRRHYAPQPPDFPVHRAEPAYLKTVWLRPADGLPFRAGKERSY